jgi:hypothetical protein
MTQKLSPARRQRSRARDAFAWAAEQSQIKAEGNAAQARPDFNREAKVQGEVIAWIRRAAPHVIAFSIPLGGLLRSKAEGARLRWLGALAGTPDLCVIAPGGRAFFIEVKSEVGRLSPEQRELHERLIRIETPVAIVRSLDDARRAFACWGIEMRGRL